MSELFNQMRLTRRSDAYWRVTFNHPLREALLPQASGVYWT